MNKKAAIIGESLFYFLGGALLLYIAVHIGIPYFYEKFNFLPVMLWFFTSGILVFAFFIAALVAAHHRFKTKTLKETFLALNMHKINKTDLVWAFVGLMAIVVLTGVVAVLFSTLGIDLLSQESYASFLRMEKLEKNQYWIFLVWIPYFFFNIVGEELLWRGYLLPRQMKVMGKWAWLFNGLLWAIFHIPIGLRIALLLIPIEFIVPYIVQKRQNTWLGIIIHGIFNGSGFILVALGIVA